MMSEDPIKDVLMRMPYGFYAITSHAGDDVNAMVANWLTQVSFEPRLISLALQKSSYTHGLVEEGGVFAVNLFLGADVEAIKPFTKSRSKKPEKMAEATYTLSAETGCPVLEGAAGVLECRVVKILDIGGDHDLVVGEVIAARTLKPGEVEDSLSLLDLGWSYAG
ncbi:MAG: flavin reductase family protein [Gammaproteobacteria bacterium]